MSKKTIYKGGHKKVVESLPEKKVEKPKTPKVKSDKADDKLTTDS